MRRAKHPVVEAIETKVRMMAEDYGYEVVDITYGGPKRNPVLTIMIDKENGVTANDCAEMSRRFSVLLDAIDPIPTSYQLAVSSPGIERPLVQMADFERFVGRRASIRFYTDEDKPCTVAGELRGVRDGQVVLLMNGDELAIAEERIDRAHLIFDWDEIDIDSDGN
ncbi:MAG: ribosome maturation factor RimP [Candidatus Zipacnadales bacterium]